MTRGILILLIILWWCPDNRFPRLGTKLTHPLIQTPTIFTSVRGIWNWLRPPNGRNGVVLFPSTADSHHMDTGVVLLAPAESVIAYLGTLIQSKNEPLSFTNAKRCCS